MKMNWMKDFRGLSLAGLAAAAVVLAGCSKSDVVTEPHTCMQKGPDLPQTWRWPRPGPGRRRLFP